MPHKLQHQPRHAQCPPRRQEPITSPQISQQDVSAATEPLKPFPRLPAERIFFKRKEKKRVRKLLMFCSQIATSHTVNILMAYGRHVSLTSAHGRPLGLTCSPSQSRALTFTRRLFPHPLAFIGCQAKYCSRSGKLISSPPLMALNVANSNQVHGK